jgi:DNA-binding response OmpR family regulator
MAKKVMLVDDDANMIKFLTALLEDNGYEVLSALDGSDGFKMLQEVVPDLLVLDVMMPKKSGFTLFKQIRKHDTLKELPVLMLTGVAQSLEEMDAESEDTSQRPYDSLREALRKQIKQMRGEGLIKPNMFVDKPIDPDSFVRQIEELIGR